LYLFESGETHFNNYNYSACDVITFLTGLGFKCYRVKDLNKLAPIKIENSPA
jgi:hypothetical protein